MSWGGGGWDERMDATHLSVFHSILNHDRRKRSSLPYAFNCTLFFSSMRLYDIHVNDLTDLYVERVTAHRIKINDHSCNLTSG